MNGAPTPHLKYFSRYFSKKYYFLVKWKWPQESRRPFWKLFQKGLEATYCGEGGGSVRLGSSLGLSPTDDAACRATGGGIGLCAGRQARVVEIEGRKGDPLPAGRRAEGEGGGNPPPQGDGSYEYKPWQGGGRRKKIRPQPACKRGRRETLTHPLLWGVQEGASPSVGSIGERSRWLAARLPKTLQTPNQRQITGLFQTVPHP